MTDLSPNNKPAFSGWPMLIGWLAMLLFALHASTHMVGAGDTWVAMACGRHFINHGVDTVEPFSANSHKPGPTAEEVKHWPEWAQWVTEKVGLDTVKYWHPTGWVNQNWLTHVIFYWLTTLSPFADAESWSFNTLVYWKFALYIMAVICVYYTGRILGVNPALSAFFACAAMFIGRSFLDVRPAGYSNMLVAAFLLILALATYRNHLYIWFIVPLTIFWSNVHGGYIYVFIMLTPVVMLRLFTILSRRWTVSLYSILTWLALYLAVFKYTNHVPFEPVAPLKDGLLFWMLLFMACSIVMARSRAVKPPLFYGYHIIVTIIIFAFLCARLFPDEIPRHIPQIVEYVSDSQRSFCLAFAAAVGMGLILTFLEDRMLHVTPAAIWHTAFAGLAAFIGSIVFNPFHLTNLTHTFIISLSENAEGWRNVHEWWPAFNWTNPVGTSFPFMVMLIVGGGMCCLWLYSRFLVPKEVKLPKLELERQERRFNILYRIFGFAAGVLVLWAVLLSFSLIDVSIGAVLLCGLFLGILWAAVFIHVHFIHLVIPFAFFALVTADKAHGYTGRYIFPFITIPCYVAVYAVSRQVSKKPEYWLGSIFYVLIAAIGALILSVWILNPFGFEEPFWHVEQFVGLKRIWHPVFEKNLDLSYANLFGILYGINGLCILGWVMADVIKPAFEPVAGEETQMEISYKLPRIDLALITIAALSVYMAFRSRRFIPIAAIASCPVIAMFSEQITGALSSSYNFYAKGRLAVRGIPRHLERFLTVTAAIVVTGLSIGWIWQFKFVYLDPWPGDMKLTSMFMRMTASHAKPFYAMEFIRMNKLSGNMFNYWTEGGFIAWGQDPDPETGKTPLQLFMDGRAQAAYNYNTYMEWAEIVFGGEVVQRAKLRHQKMTEQDYTELGAWIGKKFNQSKVWVVLMPANQFNSDFVRGLEKNLDWRLVFMNDKQRIYVNIKTPRGEELFKGIEDGSTKYPEEKLRDIMLGHNALVFGKEPEEYARGLKLLLETFAEEPMRTTAQFIQVYYQRFPALRPLIQEFWKGYYEDFTANKEKYLNEDGYHYRAVGAVMALEYFRPEAEKEGDTERLKKYDEEKAELMETIEKMRGKRW